MTNSAVESDISAQISGVEETGAERENGTEISQEYIESTFDVRSGEEGQPPAAPTYSHPSFEEADREDDLGGRRVFTRDVSMRLEEYYLASKGARPTEALLLEISKAVSKTTVQVHSWWYRRRKKATADGIPPLAEDSPRQGPPKLKNISVSAHGKADEWEQSLRHCGSLSGALHRPSFEVSRLKVHHIGRTCECLARMVTEAFEAGHPLGVDAIAVAVSKEFNDFSECLEELLLRPPPPPEPPARRDPEPGEGAREKEGCEGAREVEGKGENGDEQSGSRKFSREVSEMLDECYCSHRGEKLCQTELEKIANKCNLSMRQVHSWWYRRRNQDRKLILDAAQDDTKNCGQAISWNASSFTLSSSSSKKSLKSLTSKSFSVNRPSFYQSISPSPFEGPKGRGKTSRGQSANGEANKRPRLEGHGFSCGSSPPALSPMESLELSQLKVLHVRRTSQAVLEIVRIKQRRGEGPTDNEMMRLQSCAINDFTTELQQFCWNCWNAGAAPIVPSDSAKEERPSQDEQSLAEPRGGVAENGQLSMKTNKKNRLRSATFIVRSPVSSFADTDMSQFQVKDGTGSFPALSRGLHIPSPDAEPSPNVFTDLEEIGLVNMAPHGASSSPFPEPPLDPEDPFSLPRAFPPSQPRPGAGARSRFVDEMDTSQFKVRDPLTPKHPLPDPGCGRGI